MKLKGFFTSLKNMKNDLHPVNIVMGQDGLYEVRVTPVGIFSKKITQPIEELDRIREGFVFSLPDKIPGRLLAEIISFFRKWGKDKLEVQAQIFWDKEKKEYFAYAPKQKVSSVDLNIERNLELEASNILVMEIHSHHVMPAVFSVTDDEWEKATGLYCVVGRLDKKLAMINIRYSCGGDFYSLCLNDVFTSDFDFETLVTEIDYPEKWDKQVTIIPVEKEHFI